MNKKRAAAWVGVGGVALLATGLVLAASSDDAGVPPPEPDSEILFSDTMASPFTLDAEGWSLPCGDTLPMLGRAVWVFDDAVRSWDTSIEARIYLYTDSFDVLLDPYSEASGYETTAIQVAARGFPDEVRLVAWAVITRDGTIVGSAQVPVNPGGVIVPERYDQERPGWEPGESWIGPLQCGGVGRVDPSLIGSDFTYTVSLIVQAQDVANGEPLATYFNPGDVGPRPFQFWADDSWWEAAWERDGAPERLNPVEP